MRAVIIPQHGTVDDLQLVDDHPTPSATPGHVVVKVRASSLNSHDIFTLRGMPGITVPLPVVPGLDIAGEIAELGEGVGGWNIGDRVLVDPLTERGHLMGELLDGGLAEYALAEAGQLLALPDEVSFEQAAALPVALQKKGIDPKGIEWVPMNYSDMGAALERGDVDAIWQVDPFRTLAVDAGYRPILSNFVEAIPDTTLGYYSTSGKFAEANPEALQKFQRAMSKANEYATEHPDEFRKLAVEKIKLDPAVADNINIAVFKPGLDVESLKTMGAHAKEFGIIKEEPNYDEHVIQPEG